MKFKTLLLSTTLASTLLFAGGDIIVEEPEEVETKAWSFNVEPYLMITNIDGDSQFGNLPTTELGVNFDTILDNLDAAAMLHVEAIHQSGWGLWVDYGFMDLSNEIQVPLAPIASASITEVGVRQGVLEVFGMYRQTLDSGYIDYLAGVRWWDNNYKIEFHPLLNFGTFRKSVDWVDGIVGARYTHVFNDTWQLRVHGDIGGSSNNFTYAASAGVVYKINDLLDSTIRYKGTWVDYEEGTLGQRDYFSYDTVTHGLILGLNFKF